MHISDQGMYQSQLLAAFPVIHGFSSKKFGDMRKKNERDTFLTALGIDDAFLVQEEQVHGNSIHVVTHSDTEAVIPGVDGLVFKQPETDAHLFLSVHTADCVPILAVDPVAHVLGVAHAGWKGTILHIAKNLMKEMIKLGGQSQNIRVVIGPRICGECYEVNSNRAEIFQKEFPRSGVVVAQNRKLFVDIGKANVSDILEAEVPSEHIDYDRSYCTYSRSEEFFSFRKSGSPLDGELLGVIGFGK